MRKGPSAVTPAIKKIGCKLSIAQMTAAYGPYKNAKRTICSHSGYKKKFGLQPMFNFSQNNGLFPGLLLDKQCPQE